MQEEKNRVHRCNVCGNYKPYYVMNESCFEKIKSGYCRVCEQTKDRFDSCDKWKSRLRWLGVRTYVCERALRDITTHLMAIREILRDEKNEKDKSGR